MRNLANKGIFLSQLLDQTLWAADAKKVGKIKDVAVDMTATFPKVEGLVVEVPLQKSWGFLSVNHCAQISETRIKTCQTAAQLTFTEIPPDINLLKRAILDKQIVDINDIKVVRVNDLKLMRVEDGFRLMAVDCGLSGLLRRLKLLPLITKIPGISNRISENLISWGQVQPLKSDMTDLRLKVTYEKIFKLHPADIAEILSLVHHDERVSMIESLTDETLADVLPHLDDQTKANIIENMHLERAIDVIEELPPDEAVDILGDVSEQKEKEILDHLEPEDTEDFKELLQHEDESAGGLMNTDFVAFQPELTVADTLKRLREIKPEEEMFYYIYVIDAHKHLLGVLSLQNLVLAEPEQILREIMKENVVHVDVSADTDEIGELVSKYNVLAVPVVNEENSLLGVITVDDVVEQFIPSGFRKPRDVMD